MGKVGYGKVRYGKIMYGKSGMSNVYIGKVVELENHCFVKSRYRKSWLGEKGCVDSGYGKHRYGQTPYKKRFRTQFYNFWDINPIITQIYLR